MNILFFCNANKNVGIGHFRRCNVIGSHLIKANKDINIKYTGDIDKNFIKNRGMFTERIEDTPKFDTYDMVIFDSYNKEDYSKVNSLDTKKVSIDDKEIFDYKEWDLVVNFRLKNEYKKYESKKSLYGVKYFPFETKIEALPIF